MYQNKKQLQFIWIFKPELSDVAKRVAEDHVKWMNETHTKEGEKALIVLNWSCLLYTSPSPRDRG